MMKKENSTPLEVGQRFSVNRFENFLAFGQISNMVISSDFFTSVAATINLVIRS
jgi:hypothetical protein